MEKQVFPSVPADYEGCCWKNSLLGKIWATAKASTLLAYIGFALSHPAQSTQSRTAHVPPAAKTQFLSSVLFVKISPSTYWFQESE